MKKTKGCIYHAVNLKNRKGYVGQHKNVLTVERYRWEDHLSKARNGSKLLFHCALRKNKYECGFSWEVIWVGPIELLDEMETYYIKKLHTFVDDPKGGGYNLTMGGESTRGYKASPQLRRKRSEAAKLRWQDEAYRASMCSMQNERCSSKAHRAATSEFMKALWQDPKQRPRMLKGLCKSRNTPEARARASEVMRANWADPEISAQLLKGKVGRRAKASTKRKLRKAAKLRFSNLEARAELSRLATERWQRPGEREAQSVRMTGTSFSAEARKICQLGNFEERPENALLKV